MKNKTKNCIAGIKVIFNPLSFTENYRFIVVCLPNLYNP